MPLNDHQKIEYFERYHRDYNGIKQDWLVDRKNRPSPDINELRSLELAYRMMHRFYDKPGEQINTSNNEQRKIFLSLSKTVEKRDFNSNVKDSLVHRIYMKTLHSEMIRKERAAAGLVAGARIFAETAGARMGSVGAKAGKMVFDEGLDVFKGWSQEQARSEMIKYSDRFLDQFKDNPKVLGEFLTEYGLVDPSLTVKASVSLVGASHAKISGMEALVQKSVMNGLDAKTSSDQLRKDVLGALKRQGVDLDRLKKTQSETLDRVGLLEDGLDALFAEVQKNQQTLADYMQSQKEQETKQAERQFKTAEIEGARTSFQFLGQLGAFVKSPELVQFARAGEGFTNVLGAINKLDSLEGMGTMALAGGYAGIAMAGLSLVSSFMDQGPTPDEVIMGYLQELGGFIAEQFKLVNERLDTIHKDMMKGFQSLLEAAEKIFNLVQETLEEVKQARKDVQNLREWLGFRLDQIDIKLDVMTSLLESGFEVIAVAPLEERLNQLQQILGNQNHNYKIQNLLNGLAGYYIGQSAISFHTGSFYFNKAQNKYDIFKPNTKELFFSDETKIDGTFVVNQFSAAEMINQIFSEDKFPSRLGFLAAYLQELSPNDYKRYDQVKSRLSTLESEIATKKGQLQASKIKILDLSKESNPSVEAQKNLESEKSFLERIDREIKEYEKEQKELKEVKVVAKKSEEKLNQYTNRVGKEKASLDRQIRIKQAELSQEKKALEEIHLEVNRLSSGWKFLYSKTDELRGLGLVYKNIYELRLKDIVGVEQQSSENFKVLGLAQKAEGKFVFDNPYPIMVSESELQEESYQKAIHLLFKMMSKEKKISYLENQIVLMSERSSELAVSLSLAEFDERRSLESMVFNTHFWIKATSAYVNAIRDPRIIAGHENNYKDNNFKHAYAIIHMGKNFLHFIHVLKSNPNIFENLWRSYATALVSAYRRYQAAWKKEFDKLPEHIKAEALVNPSFVLDEEQKVAREILANDQEFKKSLIVLDAQKKILRSFYVLTKANARVMGLVDFLLDRAKVETELGELISHRQRGRFTNNFYKNTNQNFVDLVEYQKQKWKSAPDWVGINHVESLVANLTAHVAYNQTNIQNQINEDKVASESLLEKSMIINEEVGQMKEGEAKDKPVVDKDFECLVVQALGRAHMGNSENAVVVLGKTGAGKSAFISYLLKCEMAFTTGSLEPDLSASKCPVDAPKIGQDIAVSETLFPAGYKDGTNTYIDFPGFEGTRGSHITLLESIATQVAVQTIKSIKKIVVVIPYNDVVDAKALEFSRLAKVMSRVFKNFKDHQDSIVLVVSKDKDAAKMSSSEIVDRKRALVERFEKIKKGLQKVYSEEKLNQEEKEDNQLTQQFLDIFINSVNKSNLIIFNPSLSQAREELLSLVSRSKGFSPNVMSFIGNKDTKKDFFQKIDATLTAGIGVLDPLLSYPSKKKILDDALDVKYNDKPGINSQITTLEASIASEAKKKDEPSIPVPYSEGLFQQKRSEILKLEGEILSLKVSVATSRIEIQKVLDRTDTHSYDTFVWNEEDHFPGAKGIFSRNSVEWSRPSNIPFVEAKVEQQVLSCNNILKYYYTCSNASSNCDNYKDGTIRPFNNKDKIVGYYSLFPWNGLHSSIRDFKTKGSYTCWNRGPDRGEEGNFGHNGSMNILDQNKDKGIYRFKYEGPERCYGEVKISFWVRYPLHPTGAAELAKLNQQLTDGLASITDKEARSAQVKKEISDMEAGNATAAKNQKGVEERNKARKEKLAADRKFVDELKDAKKNKEAELASLKNVYDEKFKIYCAKKSFYKVLVDLHEVIKFDFEKYKDFHKKFARVLKQLSQEKCTTEQEKEACDVDLHRPSEDVIVGLLKKADKSSLDKFKLILGKFFNNPAYKSIFEKACFKAAALGERTDFIKLMLDKGVDCLAYKENGQHALEKAIDGRKFITARYILSQRKSYGGILVGRDWEKLAQDEIEEACKEMPANGYSGPDNEFIKNILINKIDSKLYFSAESAYVNLIFNYLNENNEDSLGKFKLVLNNFSKNPVYKAVFEKACFKAAALGGRTDFIKLMLDKGVDCLIYKEDKRNALEAAVSQKFFITARLILSKLKSYGGLLTLGDWEKLAKDEIEEEAKKTPSQAYQDKGFIKNIFDNIDRRKEYASLKQTHANKQELMFFATDRLPDAGVRYGKALSLLIQTASVEPEQSTHEEAGAEEGSANDARSVTESSSRFMDTLGSNAMLAAVLFKQAQSLWQWWVASKAEPAVMAENVEARLKKCQRKLNVLSYDIMEAKEQNPEMDWVWADRAFEDHRDHFKSLQGKTIVTEEDLKILESNVGALRDQLAEDLAPQERCEVLRFVGGAGVSSTSAARGGFFYHTQQAAVAGSEVQKQLG